MTKPTYEELEAQCAVMRDLLQGDCAPIHPITCSAWSSPPRGPCDCGTIETQAEIDAALSSDAGKALLERLEEAERELAELEATTLHEVLEPARRKARNDAIEEAAKVADGKGVPSHDYCAQEISAAIRALKEQT